MKKITYQLLTVVISVLISSFLCLVFASDEFSSLDFALFALIPTVIGFFMIESEFEKSPEGL